VSRITWRRKAQDPRHQAGEAGAATEIEPAAGVGKKPDQLSTVGNVTAPNRRQGSGRHQVFGGLPLLQQGNEALQPLRRFT
jgi:hypothetical protein